RLDGDIRLKSPVIGVREVADGWEVTSSNDGASHLAKHSAVVFAGPACKLPEIRFTTEHHVRCAALAQIDHPPVSSLVLGFRREDVAHPLDGFGMLVPEVEGFKILGTLFSSTLFPGRAPAGHVTLTSYIGGTRAPALAALGTDELVELTLRDLRAILGVNGSPTFVHRAFFRHSIPQYEVGYGRFKTLMNEIETRAPGFFLAGHYRDGVSLGDSIVSGHNVAGQIESFLASKPVGTRSQRHDHPIHVAA
ncbi:MAG TPA: protoporphyrinogen oxidase, partial [Candidatus Angelobacter sp.]|nr:protoporphyrinogen oxidase [Candidatus Angelobacter sp.]